MLFTKNVKYIFCVQNAIPDHNFSLKILKTSDLQKTRKKNVMKVCEVVKGLENHQKFIEIKLVLCRVE